VIIGTGRAAPARAATTITVDCAADPSALTSALASANDGDTLAIQGTCDGTFEVGNSVSLVGLSGAALDGLGSGSVVTVDSGTSVTLRGLTIEHGSASFGAGVLNLGAIVSISDSTITANTGSFGVGIENAQAGTLTLTRSTVSDNTTGINSEGAGMLNETFSTMHISDSTISNNDSSAGIRAGGIYNESAGTLTVTNSTINGNKAFVGGGLYNDGSVTIDNSTISGNDASSGGSLGGGGIYNDSGLVTVAFSTISGNTAPEGAGANLHNLGFATLENTIVAGAGANNCSLVNAYGSITDGGYNIDDGASCGLDTANHSLPSTDPLLDPAGLQDNGGPTQTIALEPASPAIDAIPSGANGCGTTITTDQRGVSRPQGAGCDIGAFEFAPQAGADLSINKSGAPNPVLSGNRLTYAIAVTNNGPQDATSVTVTDALPGSLHFTSVSSSQGTCTRSTATNPQPKGGTVTCSVGDLANGAKASITIVATTTTPGTLTNTAKVNGNETDPHSSNNSATATTTVVGT
jgi:uncharacterized repeat protein (TIGR01451 family)